MRRWTDFIDILERVEPHATGLPIPRSKKPTEFFKVYPQPNESWPHPEPNIERRLMERSEVRLCT